MDIGYNRIKLKEDKMKNTKFILLGISIFILANCTDTGKTKDCKNKCYISSSLLYETMERDRKSKCNPESISGAADQTNQNLYNICINNSSVTKQFTTSYLSSCNKNCNK